MAQSLRFGAGRSGGHAGAARTRLEGLQARGRICRPRRGSSKIVLGLQQNPPLDQREKYNRSGNLLPNVLTLLPVTDKTPAPQPQRSTPLPPLTARSSLLNSPPRQSRNESMLRLRSRLLGWCSRPSVLRAGAVPAFGQWFGGSSCGCAQPRCHGSRSYRRRNAPAVLRRQPIACLTPVPADGPSAKCRSPSTARSRGRSSTPVVKVAYEDRPVTAYRQVMETKTAASVPSYDYQTVVENRVQTGQPELLADELAADRQVRDPRQYDARPGLHGFDEPARRPDAGTP